MPSYEACFFSADIPEEHLKEVKISNFLDFAKDLKIIQKSSAPLINPRKFPEVETMEPEKSSILITMIMGSMSVKDAISKAIYGEHAKKSYPRLGEFSIDMIGESMENNGRYIAIDYPSIPSSRSFHKIESSPTYVALHDEVHRRLISTIPNPAYAAFIDAIKMVIEKTGFKWSREIWDAMDMEVGDFLNDYLNYHNYDQNDIELNTKYFTRLLNC